MGQCVYGKSGLISNHLETDEKRYHHQPDNRIQKGGKRLPSFLCLKNRFDVYGQKMTFFRDPDGLPLELHE